MRPALPIPPGPLVGREDDVAVVEKMVSSPSVRLVTITGPGGVGKTALALAVAHRRHGAGARTGFVDLSGTETADDVASIVASSLGLALAGLRPVGDELLDALGRHELTLVLDNVEQLLPAVAPMVGDLLAACPLITLLVTSRSPLRLRAETVVPLRPLAAPDPAADPVSLRTNPAVQLLLSRVAAAGATGWEDDVAAVAELCRRVDALPLALELLAPRARVASPAETLQSLSSVLDELGPAPRDLVPRQQSLRRSLSWSYRLLAPEPRSLLRWLSLFPGGSTPGLLGEVIEGSTDDPGHRFDVWAAALQLIDAGLAERVVADHGTRITMLHTTRQFGRDALSTEGDLVARRRRRDAAVASLVHRLDAGTRSFGQMASITALVDEAENIRAVLRSVEHDDPSLLLELVIDLTWYWHLRGHLREGRRWLSLAVERTADRPDLAGRRGWARLGSALLAIRAADPSLSRELLGSARADFEAAGDELGLAEVAHQEVLVAINFDDPGTVVACRPLLLDLREARLAGDDWRVARVEYAIANVDLLAGDMVGCRRWAEVSRDRFAAVGDHRSAAMASVHMATADTLTGGDGDAAGVQLAEAFDVVRAVGDVVVGFHTLCALAVNRAVTGDAVGAARAWGAATAVSEHSNLRIAHRLEPFVAALVDDARDRVPRATWHRHVLDGYEAGFDVVPSVAVPP